MNIFGYIKVGKRVSKAHRLLFEGKNLIMWYKDKPIIGTMIDGKWCCIDINGNKEILMYQSLVTQVSFLPSPHEDRERKNPSHHRWDSGRAWSCSHSAATRPYIWNHQSRMPSAVSIHQRVMCRRKDKLVQNPQRYGIHYQKTINQEQYENYNAERTGILSRKYF